MTDTVRTQAELKRDFFDHQDVHRRPLAAFLADLEGYVEAYREIIAARAIPAQRTRKSWLREYTARKA